MAYEAGNKIAGMIFAAGLGTRLAPLTHSMPKALVKVAGKPMLEHVILRFKKAGIERIVINVHHFPEAIKNFLKNNDNFGADIVISDETEKLLDTGGALAAAASMFDGYDHIVVHNADIFTDADICEILNAHIRKRTDATLLVRKRDTTRYLYFDSDNYRLKGWCNTKTGQTLPVGFNPGPAILEHENPLLLQRAFGGIHVLSVSILPKLKAYGANEPFSVIPFYVDICDRLNIHGFESEQSYYWYDIGNIERLNAVNALFNTTDTNG